MVRTHVLALVSVKRSFNAKVDLNANNNPVITNNHNKTPALVKHCGTYPTNILVGGDINGNVPTSFWGGNVVEYELLIASVKRNQR